MANELVKYQSINLKQLSNLPEEQLLDIACDLLRATNHEVRATSEKARASLARMDAIDKLGRLYHSHPSS